MNKQIVYTIKLIMAADEPGDLSECMEKLREHYVADIVDVEVREAPPDEED